MPARPWLVLILKNKKIKKTELVSFGGVRGMHIRQPQPVEPQRFKSKYLVARIPALANSPHVPGP